MIHSYLIYRITLQGFPTATQFSGIDFVTTLPAPIVTLSPIVTPGKIIEHPPIQTLFPIATGAVNDFQNRLFSGNRSVGLIGCVTV